MTARQRDLDATRGTGRMTMPPVSYVRHQLQANGCGLHYMHSNTRHISP